MRERSGYVCVLDSKRKDCVCEKEKYMCERGVCVCERETARERTDYVRGWNVCV